MGDFYFVYCDMSPKSDLLVMLAVFIKSIRVIAESASGSLG